MNIIFSNYDDLYNPYYGGGGAFAIHEVAKRLAKKHDVTVLTGKYRGSKNRIVDGVKYVRIGISSGCAKIDQLIFQIYLLLHGLHTDCDIWFESLTPPFSFSFLPLVKKEKVVGLVHMLSGSDMRRKYAIPFDIVQNFGLKLYKKFVVLSKASQEEIKRINGKASIAIIPNGITIPEKSNSKIEKDIILFMGRIEVNQKGLDLLLKSWSKIFNQVNKKLVIAGGGQKNEIEKLKHLIKDLKLQKNVEFVGRVEGEKKDNLFRRAKVVVSPSRYETFPMVALESMSYGNPFVCFDITGYSWIPDKCCLKAKTDDVADLSDKILSICQDKILSNKLSKNGENFIKAYDWDAISSVYSEYVESHTKNPKKDTSFDNTFIRNPNNFKGKFVFVSPHLDDAALSAGGLISFLSDSHEVLVVNVFTGGGEVPYTNSAKRFLRLSGIKSAFDLFANRIIEDKNAFSKKNIKVINLGFTDALFRKIRKSKVRILFGKIIPELLHIYPIFKLSVMSGKISQYDKETVEMVKYKLSTLISSQDIVFAPAVLGKHVDHAIVYSAVKSFANQKYFWKDIPYAIWNEKTPKKLKEAFIYSDRQNERINMIKSYKSQVQGLFPEGVKDLPFEKYFQ